MVEAQKIECCRGGVECVGGSDKNRRGTNGLWKEFIPVVALS